CGGVDAGTHHFRDPVLRDDPAGEERLPEGADVGGGGVDPAVATASYRKVEDIRPPCAFQLDVAHCGAAGKLVGAQELRIDQPGRPANTLLDELVEANAACPLGDERQHDVPAVAVTEALAG